MRGCLIVLVLACLTSRAHADDKPWAAGVSDARKTKATELLEQGNTLFLEKNYRGALERYREAIATWDHPAIRFNIVRCLVQLDRSVEALDNLDLALRYGSAPLEDAVYTEALAYQKMLAKQVSEVTIECKQPHVALLLDGQPLPACPMVEKRRVLPGHHKLLGTREGFRPKTIDVTSIGGDLQRFSIELVPLAGARYSYRWATWKPWTVFAGGLVVAGIGGAFEVRAFGHMRDYDNLVASQCPNGCVDNFPSTRGKHLAERDNAIGITGIAVGVAGATIGGLMLYANRERAGREVAVAPLQGGAVIVIGDRW